MIRFFGSGAEPNQTSNEVSLDKIARRATTLLCSYWDLKVGSRIGEKGSNELKLQQKMTGRFFHQWATLEGKRSERTRQGQLGSDY